MATLGASAGIREGKAGSPSVPAAAAVSRTDHEMPEGSPRVSFPRRGDENGRRVRRVALTSHRLAAPADLLHEVAIVLVRQLREALDRLFGFFQLHDQTKADTLQKCRQTLTFPTAGAKVLRLNLAD